MGAGGGGVRLLLVGAGGHARPVAEAARLIGHEIVAYAAPEDSRWLDVARVEDDAVWPAGIEGFVIALGGMDGAALKRRLGVGLAHAERGPAPPIVHPCATASAEARLRPGAVLLAGALVNPGADIGEHAIVNTGAIVEHDAQIGHGAHVSPGAIVLGGAAVGDCAMIGAGAVVLPGAAVPEGALVPALTRHACDRGKAS